MLHLLYKKIQLPFEYPFETAHGLKTHQEGLLIQLAFNGQHGWGEASHIPYYPNTNIDDMIKVLEEKRTMIETYALTEPQRFWHFLHHLLPGHDFLIAALDIAAWDLFAKMRNIPLYRAINLQWKNLSPSCYTIGLHNSMAIKKIIQAHPASTYKLKIASKKDITSIEEIRNISNANIWIDGNEAWDAATLLEVLPRLKALGCTMIEQPLHRDDWEGMVKIRPYLDDMDIIADEACTHVDSAEKCLTYYDGINIKLAKCGGLSPAIMMLQIAKRMKKKVMLGNMCENGPTANATAHLIPLADYVDIDGPLLLTETIGAGIQYNEDLFIHFQQPNGTGFEL